MIDSTQYLVFAAILDANTVGKYGIGRCEIQVQKEDECKILMRRSFHHLFQIISVLTIALQNIYNRNVFSSSFLIV
jgi:hypothetical protein